MAKLTDEERAYEKKMLKDRLNGAIEQTARGITDEELADVIREVCSEHVIEL